MLQNSNDSPCDPPAFAAFNPIPAYKPHPSKHWVAELECRGWSLEEFSVQSGLPIERLCQPFKIDREFANGCARAFGTSAEMWLNLQSQYDQWLLQRRINHFVD